MRLSQRITILRGGRVVETLDRGDASPERLLESMAPEIARGAAAWLRSPANCAPPTWRWPPARRPSARSVKAGEIVGLAGLDGHGQERFLEILAGSRRAGRRRGDRRRRRRRDARSPASATRSGNGIAYLPRDRRATGIFPTLSILDNFSIATVWRDVTAAG